MKVTSADGTSTSLVISFSFTDMEIFPLRPDFMSSQSMSSHIGLGFVRYDLKSEEARETVISVPNKFGENDLLLFLEFRESLRFFCVTPFCFAMFAFSIVVGLSAIALFSKLLEAIEVSA